MSAVPFSRRALLHGFAAAPLLLCGRSRAGRREDFEAAKARNPWLLAFESVRAPELAAALTTVAGQLPGQLTGVLWRNGPAEHERFGHRYGHWFDGDGMVQAFSFDGAGVTHRARVLDTPKRRRESRARRRVLPAFGTLPPDAGPIRGPDDMNVANTSIVHHGGRLMALWEGGSAMEVDPDRLSARGFLTWRDDLAGMPFSAHPKRDTDGSLWNIGVLTNPRPMLLLYRIDRAGSLAAFSHIPISPVGMVHDFVVTARHLVVLLPPFVVEPDRFATGRHSFLDAHAWRPELGTRVLVIDKNSLAPARRHELAAGFHFHHGNGWEENDGTINLDLCQAPDHRFVVEDFRALMRGEWRFPSEQPRYRSLALRPDGNARIEDAAPGTAEFPRIDPRHAARRHHKVFALVGADDSPASEQEAAGDGVRPVTPAPPRSSWPLKGVACLRPDGGETDRWCYPPPQIPEEHVFVPRGPAEGDGWLIGPFLDIERGSAGLAVFDALHLEDGPVWQGVLPYPMPLALHGTFVGA